MAHATPDPTAQHAAPATPAAYVRTREAAAFLQVSARCAERWRLTGYGPRYRRHGRVVVYDVGDLRAWSDAHARTSTSERQPAA